MPAPELSRLEARLGHRFRDRALLEEALTHRSRAVAAKARSNQRLEFLGDAVLHLAVAEALYRQYPDAAEGRLTQWRATLCCGPALAALGERLGLGEFLRLGPLGAAELATGRAGALEDALEAVAGAVLLDSDFPTAARVVLAWLGDLDGGLAAAAGDANPKGRLQERFQPRHGNAAVSYEMVEAVGPDNDRTFTARVLVLGRELGRGAGRTKKAAEEAAAEEALARLHREEAAEN